MRPPGRGQHADRTHQPPRAKRCRRATSPTMPLRELRPARRQAVLPHREPARPGLRPWEVGEPLLQPASPRTIGLPANRNGIEPADRTAAAWRFGQLLGDDGMREWLAALYRGLVSIVDWNVGRLLDALRARNLERDAPGEPRPPITARCRAAAAATTRPHFQFTRTLSRSAGDHSLARPGPRGRAGLNRRREAATCSPPSWIISASDPAARSATRACGPSLRAGKTRTRFFKTRARRQPLPAHDPHPRMKVLLRLHGRIPALQPGKGTPAKPGTFSRRPHRARHPRQELNTHLGALDTRDKNLAPHCVMIKNGLFMNSDSFRNTCRFVALALILQAPSMPAAKGDFFVATNGNDSSNGRLGRARLRQDRRESQLPFAKAQAAVQQLFSQSRPRPAGHPNGTGRLPTTSH